MKFDLFKQLYQEALEYDDIEFYIAERGWQEWMDGYAADEIAEMLKKIYTLANNPLKDSRQVSRVEFSRLYDIPIRTLEGWDAELRTPPAYVKMLLDFAQFSN